MEESPNKIGHSPTSVSLAQHLAANFILNCGPFKQGLSHTMAGEYLDSLDERGEFRQMWPTRHSFWRDHKKQQEYALQKVGRWKKVQLRNVREDLLTSYAYVRMLPGTLIHIIETANVAFKETSGFWEKNLKLIPAPVYDRSGNRIIHDV